ncbi:hypothetical protein NP233_g3246 [Leucocoprinus birnbaumii]|uniref:[histone H3]-lysine(36) N-trimethyltransferase n=1 Tax=Leucocoprinus birnbaumii TaxID=56174 RepID=A0AAD5YYG6_9AGAR|nr:hypothetical protein NP233_g3246 [Leucocoprinus birnbaumii]
MVKVEDGVPPQTNPSFASSSRSHMDVDCRSDGPASFENSGKLKTSVKLEHTVRLETAVKLEPIVKLEDPVKLEDNIKLEDPLKPSSPSNSPTFHIPQSSHRSPTPTPPPESALDDLSTNGTTSKASTPPLRQPKKLANVAPQLIGDLPIAREAALASFNEIRDNNYQYKTLGRSRELLESMTCDCTYEHGIDSEDMACGPYSDCINRLTQVECLEGDCRCRNYCQNQRFQLKQYANIEIVLTEKKGYGLRAEEDLPKDTFIYEYVGDVVNPVSFKKRMREYAQEGIQHFYFMMLQKDEAIGDMVRMGIFAKRLIRKHEELTFNYNVDRYGHQAQTCYCGEPNCVGYIGGKTQTEFAAMDDLYLDALGITDENELMELKGTKKKKGKKIDDPDFMPDLKPVVEKDIPKVVQAIRQTTSRKMLCKILTRIKARITEDQAALRQLMRLRGYSIMTNVLNDHKEDLEIIYLSLECMERWPLMNKNKVEDSQVYLPVEEFTKLEDEKTRLLAQKLLDHWNTLPTYNRIPKRLISAVELGAGPSNSSNAEDEDDAIARREQDMKRARLEEEQRAIQRLQARVRSAQEKQRKAEEEKKKPAGSPEPERPRPRPGYTVIPYPTPRHLWYNQEIQSIILDVQKAKAAEAAQREAMSAAQKATEEHAAAEAAKMKEKEREKAKERKKKKAAEQQKAAKEAKEANKEKRLLKLVGAVVVKSMSKYAKGLPKEDFKKHAKEAIQLTHLIAEKEKKSSSYKENRLDSLSDEKVAKIKKFCRDYITKLLRKLEKSGRGFKSGSSGTGQHSTPSTSAATPSSAHDDVDRDYDGMEMSVEEAMDLDDDDNRSDHHDDDADEDQDDLEDGTTGARSSPPPIMPTPPSPDSRVNAAWGQGNSSWDDGFGLPASLDLPHESTRVRSPTWMS